MDRKYSVQELDALRQCIRNKYLWGSYAPSFSNNNVQQGMSRAYREDEMVKMVEEEVRTHMLAGHTAEDLLGRGQALPDPRRE